MRAVSPIVQAFRRRSTVVLLSLAAVAPASAYAQSMATGASPTATASATAQPVEWAKSDIAALVGVIETAEAEGLDPHDYNIAALREAAAGGRASSLVMESALRLASDFRYGRVSGSDRVDWHSDQEPNRLLLTSIIAQAVRENRIADAFERLLPQSDDYKALKRALAETPASDAARRMALRVNLERWRWMPRELGAKHIFVNIPSYRVELVENGDIVADHAAVVGKPSTPTPTFSTEVRGVRLNPTWAVPPGLKAEKLALYKRNPAAARRKGYSIKYGPDGPTIFQAPGPANALGQVRLVMPNPYMIYLHDTPEKQHFGKNARALSSGCVRTDRPVEFAARLIADDGRDTAVVDAALATRKTREIELTKAVPVHITYMTAEADSAGGVKLLSDPYGRDARVAKALSGRMELASR